MYMYESARKKKKKRGPFSFTQHHFMNITSLYWQLALLYLSFSNCSMEGISLNQLSKDEGLSDFHWRIINPQAINEVIDLSFVMQKPLEIYGEGSMIFLQKHDRTSKMFFFQKLFKVDSIIACELQWLDLDDTVYALD